MKIKQCVCIYLILTVCLIFAEKEQNNLNANNYTDKQVNIKPLTMMYWEKTIKERNDEIKRNEEEQRKIKEETYNKINSRKTKIIPVNLESKSENIADYELYTLTAYSNHYRSTGKNEGDKDYGITASGKKTSEGLTIAADWRKLPKGTIVWIEGVGERRVDDKGGAIKGNRIDVYFESEEDALEFGKRKDIKVKIISIPNES